MARPRAPLLWPIATAAAFALGALAEMRTGAAADLFAASKRGLRVALDLPKPSWGLEGRLPPAEGRPAVPCPVGRDPLVIATGGQSNAANTNSAPDGRAPSGDVLTFHGGACRAAASPVLGATGLRGSLWPALGDALVAELGRPVVFVHGAVGGTEFTDWLDRRSGYLPALEARLAAAAAAGLRAEFLLWHQGETDGWWTSGPEESRAKLEALTDALLDAAPGATLYLFRASRCRGGGFPGRPSPAVIAAQTRVAAAHPRIVAGMDTDALGDDFRWDGCHFNGRAREAIVEEVSADLAVLLRDGA